MLQGHIARLRDRQRQYTATEQFRVGDLVMWKDGLDNRTVPRPNHPAIVTRVYPAPIFCGESRSAGHPLFREPLDIVVAHLDEDGDFMEFHLDSHRLHTVPESDCSSREVARLRSRQALFSAPHSFQVGDVVRWKEGFKNKKKPETGQPAIVLEVLPTPITDPTDETAGNPYFREPLDVKLALLDSDGEMMVYHFDSRRFEAV